MTEKQLLSLFIACGLCILAGVGFGVVVDTIVKMRSLSIGIASGAAAMLVSANMNKEGMNRAGRLWFVSIAAGFAAWLVTILLPPGA